MTKTAKPKNLARRERLHPDWPITVFAFDAWPAGDIPDHLWQTAKLQQQLWNDLCGVFDAARAADVEGLAKDERRAVYAPAFDLKHLRSIAQGYRGLLPSACYYAVADKFLVTVKEWRKAPSEKGAPRREFSLKSINLPLVFSEGRATDWLSGHDSAPVQLWNTLHLKKQGGDAYRLNGWFEVGVRRERINLHVACHRPLPAGGRVKRATLVGRFEPSLGPGRWRWQLQIQVEHPAAPALPQAGRVAGLDLGWRVREDGLRVGYLTDAAGNRYELLLPFVFGNHAARKRAEWLRGKGLEPGTALDWRDIAEWQAVEDGLLEDCKAKLGALDDDALAAWPEESRRRLRGLQKMRAGGLRRLHKELNEAGVADAGRLALEEWREKATPIRRRIRGAQLQAADKRRDLYRQLARWLALNFDALAWEGELSLKQMSRRPKRGGGEPQAGPTPDDYALKNSQEWRHVAGLSSLRLYVRQAFTKAGRQLLDGGTAYTSQVCHVCGGHVEPSRKLQRVCENGHRADQDEVASRNLLGSLESYASTPVPRPEIPVELRRCVRVLAVSE